MRRHGSNTTGRFLLLLLAGALVGVFLAGTALAALPQAAPLNPDFLRYQQQEKVLGKTAAAALRGGEIPAPVDLSHLNRVSYTGVKGKAAPAAYDLRSTGRVTSVKNQNPYGTCWAYAALGSLESGLMPGENLDLSEWHLAYYTYVGDHAFTTDAPAFGEDPIFDQGGNAYKAVAMLAGWVGPVAESACPYGKPDPSGPYTNYPDVKHLTDAFVLGNQPTSETIKALIQQYGGLHVSYYDESNNAAYYNAANAAYYYNGASASNHAVLVVGWDDAYSAGNFSTNPGGDGAWLIKNSWGTAWGDQGYFWISYYDTSFGNGTFYRSESTANFSRLYQYDPLGWVGARGYGNTTAWMANVFTAQGNDAISAVGFYTTDANVTYEISVYVDGASGPTSGTRVAGPQTGTQSYAGFHTVRLNTPVNVTAGQKFSVVVKLVNSSYTFPVPCEYAEAGYSDKARANAGESYMSSDGTTWADLTAAVATGNVCLKAYAAGSWTPTVTAAPTRVPSGGGGGGCSGLGFAPLAVLILLPLLALKRR